MERFFPDLYPLWDHPWQDVARSKGMEIRTGAHYIDVIDGNRVIRIAVDHAFYAHDLLVDFDYFFLAVVPIVKSDMMIVDYSLPRYHDVVGYDRHPVLFPSFSEPLPSAHQYMDFAALRRGDTVVDLGAYSGLTSIVFKDIVGPSGRVIAVEADARNISAAEKNLAMYKGSTGNHISLERSVIWNHCEGVSFSSEGNMGSSATAIVGDHRAENGVMPSLTLSALADKHSLAHIDFLKCDIEGGEAFIFRDAAFFDRFRPRIIFEPHYVEGKLCTDQVCSELATHGYRCTVVDQGGIGLPLVECMPA